jgi:hypothetical protein
VLALAGAAAANAIRIRVGVSGTQAAQVRVTDTSGCGGTGVPATGDFSELASFQTYQRSAMVVFNGEPGGALEILPQNPNRGWDIVMRGQTTRTSTLGGDGHVACGDNPASCGTRSVPRLTIRAGPDNAYTGHRRFRGIEFNNGPKEPSNPLPACLAPAPLLFPIIVPATVPFPASFLTSCRPGGTLTRRGSKTLRVDESGSEEIQGATTVNLRVTVTRLGPLRGTRCQNP